MKILHIVPSYKPAYIYGGTIESIARLCESLAQAGVGVTVYTTTANGNEELDVEPGKPYDIDGVRVVYFNRQTKDPLHVSYGLLRRLYKDCREFDVVHIHSWWNVLVMAAAFICKRQKIKTVFSPHGMLSDYIIRNSNSKMKQFIHSAIGKSLLGYMRLHATSQPELDESRQVIPGWHGFVLPNMVWFPDMKILKNQTQRFTIVFLSRIHPKKGIELLFEAISKLDIDVCLEIAGSGEEQYINQLKTKAKLLGIENRLNWLGWKDRTEKFELLMQADLFALTSYNENFANVVVEALYVGTPVVISENIGLAGFVKQNNLGWICKTVVPDIVSTLREAIKDKEKRRHINKIAPHLTRDHFSEKNILPQYLLYYRS